MNPSDPRLTDYPPSLILPGVRLQEALRQDTGIQEAFDTYCRRAFRQPDSAPQGAAFLANTFAGDTEKLLGYVESHHLVSELAAGSHMLASLAAEHWDRTANNERLAQLADSLTKSWSAKLENPAALEFMVALATAVSILHPEKATALLDRCGPSCASVPALREACAEAREWTQTGKLVGHASPDQKHFWHSQLAKRGGDWIWDTAEAKQAVQQLEAAAPDEASKARLLQDRIPGWAWNLRVQRPSATPSKVVAETRPSRGLAVLKWAAAIMIGTTVGALWTSAPARRMVASLSSNGETQATVVAVTTQPSLAAQVSTSSAPSIATSEPLPAEPSEAPKPIVATLPQPSIESSPAPSLEKPLTPAVEAAEPPMIAAQPLPVIKSDRAGWVKTPLGTEFAITAANVSDGRITDPEGRVWSIPAELCSPVESPASAPVVPEQPKEISTTIATVSAPIAASLVKTPTPPLVDTSTPIVPPPPPVASTEPVVQAEIPTKKTLEPAASTSETAPTTPTISSPAVVTAPVEEPTTKSAPQPSTPAAADDLKPASSATLAQTAAPTRAAANVEPTQPERKTGQLTPTPSNLHPDYFAKAMTTTQRSQPVASAHANKSTSTSLRSSTKTSAPTRPSTSEPERSFVTRANNIRMRYRNGLWESQPGAYLAGAAGGAQEWARDMTLRERSSGTIPDNYVFQVMRNGAVQIVPDPTRQASR